jgi:hypothetical protein
MSTTPGTPFNLAHLLKSSRYSDLKVICQDQEFKVHRAIVCAQSPVLAAAFDGAFQVLLFPSKPLK